MKKYKISFIGRVKGAIGKFYKFSKTVEADTEEAAIIKLYETHDHIHPKTIKQVKK